MDTSTMVVIIVGVVIVGLILGLIFSRRQKTEQLQTKFLGEYLYVRNRLMYVVRTIGNKSDEIKPDVNEIITANYIGFGIQTY